MVRAEQNPTMRSKSQGRDSPPSSDSSSPGESTSSGGTRGSQNDHAAESFSVIRPSYRSHALKETKETKETKHLIRIVSKVPENARSLQELDEIIGAGTVSSARLHGQSTTNSRHLSEDEYYYDDDDIPTAVPKPSYIATVKRPQQKLIGNLEEVKLVQHLMRSPPPANDLHSVWSSRSRSSSKSTRRKRGSSLEREISRTILQTAVAGEAEAAHFLVDAENPTNIGNEDLMTLSAQFILTDLFYEAARQKMEDALPNPSIESDEASSSSRNGATPEKSIPFPDDDPWFPSEEICFPNDSEYLEIVDAGIDSSAPFQSSFPLANSPATRNATSSPVAVYSKPIYDEELPEGAISFGGIDVTTPISRLLTPSRIGDGQVDRETFTQAQLSSPPHQTFFDTLVGFVATPELLATNQVKPVQGSVNRSVEATSKFSLSPKDPTLVNEETNDNFESWVDFGSTAKISTETFQGGQESDFPGNKDLTGLAKSFLVPNKDDVRIRNSSSASEFPVHSDDTDSGICSSQLDMFAQLSRNTTSPNPSKSTDDVFDGLDSAASSFSWITFGKQSPELVNSEGAINIDRPRESQDKKASKQIDAGTAQVSYGSENWSPEERALYFHPKQELPTVTASAEKFDPSSATNEGGLQTQTTIERDTPFFNDVEKTEDERSSWTSFDNIPTSFIPNPFKGLLGAAAPCKEKATKLAMQKPLIPPPPPHQQMRIQRGQTKQRETLLNESFQTTHPNGVSSPDHSRPTNTSQIHYSPASVFDLEVVTKRALSKGPRFQPATSSASATWTPQLPLASHKREASF